MTDEAWQRHANPWSVYTRFAAILAGVLAIWSRTWCGWWALVPVGLVIVWLRLNPHVFSAVREPRGWAAKGIYGEKLWLDEPAIVPPDCHSVLRWLIIPGVAGSLLLVWGFPGLTFGQPFSAPHSSRSPNCGVSIGSVSSMKEKADVLTKRKPLHGPRRHERVA